MNPTMMVISRIFAVTVLTRPIISGDSCEKPQITEATKTQAPPKVKSKVRLKRLIR